MDYLHLGYAIGIERDAKAPYPLNSVVKDDNTGIKCLTDLKKIEKQIILKPCPL